MMEQIGKSWKSGTNNRTKHKFHTYYRVKDKGQDMKLAEHTGLLLIPNMKE